MLTGWKLGKKIPNKLLGAFLGFMLTMGGFIVHWWLEYRDINTYVTELCAKEGGLTVYVTPEEWRKQIGEEEWSSLVPINDDIPEDAENKTITFQGETYDTPSRVNHRVWTSSITDYLSYRVYRTDRIYYDIKSKQVLFRQVFIGGGHYPNLPGALKGWLNNINVCDHASVPPKIRFFSSQYTNQEIGATK